ncbi:MAG: glucosaminidase domain-containing protein, partial [Proteobacteria bacterium]|nr:glucosaminidase domain-containing protein [Pseudomonadota bacterium]
MAQSRPVESEHRPKLRGDGLVLPTLLCVTIVTFALLTLSGRNPAPEPGSAQRFANPLPGARVLPVRLLLFEPPPALDLARLLDAAWSTPGTEDAVPNLAPIRLPEDMDALDKEAKKNAFFRSVLPHVLATNRRIRAERARLRELRERLLAGRGLSDGQGSFVAKLASRYRVDLDGEALSEFGASALVEALLERVDVVPPSLALAQAAIESAWGSSRFSRLGNSLFGQWVFAADRGIAPLLRGEGANYSVARFVDLAEAVEAYVSNLNSFWAYEEFRVLRRSMREAEGGLDAQILAGGLRLYSVRREEYVDEVRKVMRNNRLGRLDSRRLTRVP